MRIAFHISVLVLGASSIGCATSSVNSGQNIDWLDGEKFKLRLFSVGVASQLESEDSERTRIAVLEDRLREEGACPEGYAITDRKVIAERNPSGASGMHSILYYGECSRQASHLVERDGLMYLPGKVEPFSGRYLSCYRDSSGQVSEKGECRDKVFSGTSNFEEPKKGQRKEEGTYRDGRKDGLFTIWQDNGEKGFEETYKDGEEEGLWTRWYENGRKQGEIRYREGVGEGLFTYWYENGQKEQEGTHRDGIREGLFTFWYENGQKKAEETYQGGKAEGLFTYWHENGQKAQEGTYKDGKKDGHFYSWDENGQKRREATFKDGEPVPRPQSSEIPNNDKPTPSSPATD